MDSQQVQQFRKAHHALNMLAMHAAGHCQLTLDKFDEYWDAVTAVLEVANDTKNSCITPKG